MVDIERYNPEWPIVADDMCEELGSLVPAQFINLEHIGSTAVADMSGKPVIDLLASVRALADVDDLQLKGLGFIRSSVKRRERLLFTRDEDGPRTFNLHIVPARNWSEVNERLFRDRLRENEAEAREYGQLKAGLVANGLGHREYVEGKTDFVQKIIDLARSDRGMTPSNIREN